MKATKDILETIIQALFLFQPNMDQLSRPPSVGTCVPSGCSENSITKIFHEILSFKSNIKTGSTTLLNVQCPLTTEQLEWTTANMLAM